MAEITSAESEQPLSQPETDALNRHGVFFKKWLVQALSHIDGIGVIAEELGVSFGGTRVMDVLARDTRSDPELFFVFEAKRAYVAERRWIFFPDFDPTYRLFRIQSGFLGHTSTIVTDGTPAIPVCSEGYEYRKTESKADQDPVFKAGAQLAAAYLGLIARRNRDFNHPSTKIVERYVPVLVTNAELVVLGSDLDFAGLETGKVSSPPIGRSVDMLVLKHPFPTPEGIERDFRDHENPMRSWSQLHKESLYVVRSTALSKFLSRPQLDNLHAANPSGLLLQ